jgi:hypothetical protein
MDEARRVIERLGRIDALRSGGAEPRAILAELRELVREGREWAAVEGAGAGQASSSIGSLDESLQGGPGAATRPDGGGEVVLTDAAL